MTKAISIRADGSWTAQALAKVEEMAAANRTQATIAAEFDLTKREFEAILGKAKGRNEVRLAWERGAARVEQNMQDALVASAMGTTTEELVDEPVRDERGQPTGETRKVLVRTVSVSKMQGTERIFFLKAKFGWKEGEQTDKGGSNVVLMLPKPRTRAEFFAMMGQQDPKERPGGPTGLKDVTPATPALASPDRPSDEVIRERVRALTTPKESK